MTHFAVYTSLTHGDLIGSGVLTSDLLIQNKEQPLFNIGTIIITEN